MSLQKSLAALLFLLPGCSGASEPQPAPQSSTPSTTSPAGTPATPKPTACERLRGLTFESKARAPENAEQPAESVAFGDDGRTYTWFKDGARTTSSYTCDGDTLRAHGVDLTADLDFEATYDVKRDVLVWNGVELPRATP